jgi:uroporphyrinogen-III decarboxylase
MKHRERFQNIYHFRSVDRLPCYYFGTWKETKIRWKKEGFLGDVDMDADKGPQLPDMDPDWEDGLWNCHGLVNLSPIGDLETKVIKKEEHSSIVSNSLGKIERIRTDGSSIPHTLLYPLEPTRESWNRFKRFLDPSDTRRYPQNMVSLAKTRNSLDIVTSFMGGSFYGWIRDFMGVENLSYMMYDDPVLLEDIVCYLTTFFMELMKPVLQVTNFDFVYFFEDCCGSNGPLFSPAIYQRIFNKYYQKLIEYYKSYGVPLALIDSDGAVEQLVPCWLSSGFDIIFPLEVGVWGASPAMFRKKFGQSLKILGGLDKHLISAPEDLLRQHMIELKIEVEKGGFIPIPDHRIPPSVSYSQMTRYIELFHEIFNQ